MKIIIGNKKGNNNFKKIKQIANEKPTAIILSTQRSGSTLLCDYFNQKGFGKPDEHILKMMSIEELENFEKGETDFISKRFNIDEYIDLCVNNDVFSTKIMINHIDQIIDQFLCLDKKVNQYFKYLKFIEMFSNSLMFFLKRENVLMQAISRHYAANTGVCHEIATEKFYFNGVDNFNNDIKKRVIYSFKSIEKEMNLINHQNSILDNICKMAKMNGINIVNVNYENFAKSTDNNREIINILNCKMSKFGKKIQDLYYIPSLKITSSLYSEYMALIHSDIKKKYIPAMSDEQLFLLISEAVSRFKNIDPEWFDTQISYIHDNRYF